MTDQTEKARYPYGTVTYAVAELVRAIPPGREFYYGDVAEELDVQLPTASGILLKMARAQKPVIERGSKSGWYRKLAPPQAREPGPAPYRELPKDRGLVGQVMEVIGTTKNGRLLRDEDGIIWQAERM